jgi:hypothetical protein
MTNNNGIKGIKMTQEYNGKTYTGRNALDIAMQIADDKQDAERTTAKQSRSPRKSDKCSCKSNIFRL